MNPLAQAVLAALDDEALDALAELLADRVAARFTARVAPSDDAWIDAPEAARYLHLTLPALHKLTGARRIPFAQDGPGCKCWFKRSELDRWRRGDIDPGWNLATERGADAAISLPRRSATASRRAAA